MNLTGLFYFSSGDHVEPAADPVERLLQEPGGPAVAPLLLAVHQPCHHRLPVILPFSRRGYQPANTAEIRAPAASPNGADPAGERARRG